MKTQLQTVNDHGKTYDTLMFVCPGCVAGGREGHAGLHMLPVNVKETNDIGKPSWSFDGNLVAPTLSPSILTRGGSSGPNAVCHSFLRQGMFEFLQDCTHPLSGQTVPIPDLPEWAIDIH